MKVWLIVSTLKLHLINFRCPLWGRKMSLEMKKASNYASLNNVMVHQLRQKWELELDCYHWQL